MRQHHVKPIEIGSLKQQNPCQFCDALLWPTETSQICCKQGSLYDKNRPFESPLQFLPDPPPQILHLINTPSLARNLSQYNNALAMASIGGEFPENSATTRLQGKMYHSLGSLGPPAPGERPKFASIYFHDPDHEEEHRMAHLSRTPLQPEILRSLQDLLKQINSYLVSFRAAIEVYGAQDNVKIVILSTATKKIEQGNVHPGCFSLPQGSEVIFFLLLDFRTTIFNQVAAILPGEPHEEVDVVLHLRGGGVKQISPCHRSYDALAYVLLNPYGKDGWHPGLLDLNGKSISIADFYGFHAQVDGRCQDSRILVNSYIGATKPIQRAAEGQEAESVFLD